MQTRDSLKPIYLDHNATTQIEQSVLETSLLFFLPSFGNASSIHWAGRQVKSAIDDARESIATILKIQSADEICFTSGATESTNACIKGAFFYEITNCRAAKNFHLITSSVEHEATLESAQFIKSIGAEIHILPVNSNGEIFIEELEEKLKKLSADKQNFILLSFMVANNETGVIFPYVQIGELAARYGALYHLDAVQALGKMDFSLEKCGAQFASISAHKIGGPKGVGAHYIKRGMKLVNLLHGGAQERKRRAGTLNVPGIVGMGKAASLLSDWDISGMSTLRLSLEEEVKARISGTHIQGEKAKWGRISNTSNFLFDGVRGESLLMGLDVEGFAVSSGSACNSGSIGPSHVLLAMGHDKIASASAVRVSIGRHTTKEELTAFVTALEKVVARIRQRKSL